MQMSLYESNSSIPSYGQIGGQTELFNLSVATSLGEGKLWIQTSRTLLKKLILYSILIIGEGLGKCIFIAGTLTKNKIVTLRMCGSIKPSVRPQVVHLDYSK